MGLVGGITGELNKATNLVTSGFKSSLGPPVLDKDDFSEGFVIEEILPTGQGQKVVLIGNLMPHIPLKFGGSQRMKKEFYSGYSEPTMQVFGPEEDDIVINGEFKDKKYKAESGLKGVATEFQQMIDAIRIRGNIVRFRLGEMERYALISKTSFELDRITKVKYSITFSVIGFNKPKNAIFLQKTKEYPFAINGKMIAAAASFQSTYTQMPSSVPLGIADQIRNLISDVASAIASVTNFVDQVIASVEDIRKAIERAKGLVKHVQNKLRSYKKLVGGFQPFNTAQALTGRYENAKFYSGLTVGLSSLSAMLNSLRSQFSNLADSLPLARHLVKADETLQKISIKFFGTSDNWKKIYDFNNLTSTQLETGRLLEIPRL